jgi:hypothetical protein
MNNRITLFMQVSLTLIVVGFSCYQLANKDVSNEIKLFYGGLLSNAIGRWMPSPGEGKNNVGQLNVESQVENQQERKL